MTMIGVNLEELDTPSLIIDLDRMVRNLREMQDFADAKGVKLRPHTKTHKIAEIAHLQLGYGACGITVAKVSEAQTMVEAGIQDVFIATQVVGRNKLARLQKLAEKAKIRLAIDNLYHVEHLVSFFGDQVPVEVMIEVDPGMHRCGVEPGEAVQLAGEIRKKFPQVKLAGIFTHEGHTYNAANKDEMKDIALSAQFQLIETGKKIMEQWGIPCEISIGCTLGQLVGEILPGITEIRPGTYVFYDVGHAHYLGGTDACAVSVLSTVTTRKGDERAVADAGAKSITIDQRNSGVLKTNGFGLIKTQPDLIIKKLSDEHAVIQPAGSLQIGDRIEIIPNHVCPTVNLYDQAYGVRNGKVEKIFRITARGCTQ